VDRDAPHPIVAEELELLRRVTGTLAELPPPDDVGEAPLVRELERLREQMLQSPDGKDAVSLREQWHRQSSLLRQLRSSRAVPRPDPGSPYFAHLRLEEEGGTRDLCLGRTTCTEGGLRIVDWRHAPISKVFYRYRQGEEYEEVFGGRLRSGQVAARRTLAIREGRLERVEAPEGLFRATGSGWRREQRERPRLAGGEAAAVRAWAMDPPAEPGTGAGAGAGRMERAGRARRLGTDPQGVRRRADKHLPEITSLLDPDQFALISRPKAGFLAIRGTAGSGKTTVALHRIAFLAYDDPDVDTERTLVVVFSRALARYVSHVLPALGVERVRIVTFGEWAHEQRRRHFPRLPAELREDASALDQRLKLHPLLLRALDLHVRRSPGPPTPEQALDDWASALTREDLLRELAGDAGEYGGDFRPDELRRFTEDQRRKNEEIFAWMAGDGEAGAALEAEDDALLLRTYQLRVGPLRRGRAPLRYRHLAIDEVQDLAPVEVRVLVDCLDENRSLTLAGDTQQHVSKQSGFTSWSGFLARLGIEGQRIETLSVSYRSSQEIVDFAGAVLGDLREDEEPARATRSGPPVEIFRFTDRGACVAFLADALRELQAAEPLASVAVLTPEPRASELYHQGLGLGDVPNLRRVADGEFTFAPGVEVTEVEQAKGLEFDYVVLVDADAWHYPDRPGARRLLHVGATRAVHQLWLTCVGTPTPLAGRLAART